MLNFKCPHCGLAHGMAVDANEQNTSHYWGCSPMFGGCDSWFWVYVDKKGERLEVRVEV